MGQPHFVFWKDRQNTYLGCNGNFARLCGVVEAEDVVGKKDQALAWPKEQAEAYTKADQEVMEKGAPLLDHEEMCVGNCNKRMCVLASRVPLWDDAHKEVIGLAGMLVDITELAQRELTLSDELADLKRFREISFEREIRMIELKKEVNRLVRELGRPPAYDLSFLPPEEQK